MQLTGLAMPYLVVGRDDSQVTVTADGTIAPLRSERPIRWARGACLHAIQQDDVEILVNHVWREHLASTRHGLMLWETFAGLYFSARLPDTPYARSIYQSVTAGKIRHVCALSSSTECDDDGEVLTVRRANLAALNFLATASAHRPETWIAPAGEASELRISQEAKRAEARALWAVNPNISLNDVMNELAKADGNAEARMIRAQLMATQQS